MSYIVCRSCKNFFKVDENIPLSFDKCERCGHLLEFAGNDSDLNMILNDVKMPEVSYHKICMSCHSSNPRETGACLHCGSTNLHFQYDVDSFMDFQKKNGIPGDLGPTEGVKTVIIKANPKVSSKNLLIFRIFSLIVGLIDFFFFTILGMDLIFGVTEFSGDVMPFVTENFYPLLLIITVSLVLAGIMSVMIIPKMSYGDAVKTSSTLGFVIGLITLVVSKNILTLIVSIVFCMLLTMVGGLIGEFILHKLIRN